MIGHAHVSKFFHQFNTINAHVLMAFFIFVILLPTLIEVFLINYD